MYLNQLLMTLKIGITGGIGTGKTAASNFFKKLGVPVFNADQEAKWLMNNEPSLIQSIKDLFGDKAYIDNSLNRSFIADHIFKDQKIKEKMEQLVHPAVGNHFQRWISKQEVPYILKEAALIYEIGDEKNLDHVIVVDAALDERIERVKKRDNSNLDAISDRIKNQMEQHVKVGKADFILFNNEGLDELEKAVYELDIKLKNLAS